MGPNFFGSHLLEEGSPPISKIASKGPAAAQLNGNTMLEQWYMPVVSRRSAGEKIPL
jgi:hypothetical protein